MAFVTGKSILLYVDTGSTFEALDGEVVATLSKSSPNIAAANKSVSGHIGADYGDGKSTQISVSGHLVTGTEDAAIAAIEDHFDAGTKCHVRYVVPNPYNRYVGNTVVTAFEITGDNADYAQFSATLIFDGAPTKSSTP